MADSKKEFGAHVRRLRLGVGLAQGELAKAVGCSQSNISQIESGRSSPSVDCLLDMARVLGVSVEQLVGGVGAAPEIAPGLVDQLRRMGLDAQQRLAGLLRRGVIVPVLLATLAGYLARAHAETYPQDDIMHLTLILTAVIGIVALVLDFVVRCRRGPDRGWCW